jgi:hypothetical protein
MMRSIGSALDRSPDVTGHHGQEGADARGDRITHFAPARLWDRGMSTRRKRQHADPFDPADRRGAVLRVRGLRDLGPRDPQLDRAAAPGSSLGGAGQCGCGWRCIVPAVAAVVCGPNGCHSWRERSTTRRGWRRSWPRIVRPRRCIASPLSAACRRRTVRRMDKRVLRRWAATRPRTPLRYLGVDEIFLG